MTDDSAVDVEILHVDGRLENLVRFTPAFWHRLYAGLAMQGMLGAIGPDEGWPDMMVVACRSSDYADAMIAHKTSTEVDGEPSPA